MSEVPSWWLQVTGGAAIAVLLLCVLMTVVAFMLVLVLLQVRRSVADLNEKVQSIASRVESVAKQVEQVTTEVGSRTTGIVRTVDDIAAGAFSAVERYAPLLLGAAAVIKLVSLSRRTRK